MKKRVIIGLVALLVGIAALNISNISMLLMSSNEELTRFEVVGDEAIMTGVISEKTIDEVKNLKEEHPEVTTIVMKNVPGSMDDVSNLIASRLVREYGYNTHVPKDGMIASGGTDFFTAGVKRTVEKGAEVGVHSWAGGDVDDATKLPKDHEEHQKYIDYYKEMGIPEDFYWFTIQAAPASDIYNMTHEEMNQYKLLTE